ncbi:hypothetical protein PUN28_002691 [Cardiocondyla obscurior]|uniref:Uncharacterized protein n=1 Tax=Cardiocondyla obscurior TaxID=286306 RepID=A0AAW2GVP0_9HYME
MYRYFRNVTLTLLEFRGHRRLIDVQLPFFFPILCRFPRLSRRQSSK